MPVNRWERTKNTWRIYGIEIMIVSAIFLIVVGVGYSGYLGSVRNEAARKAFMFECTKEHKEYECTAMWRSGEKKPDSILILR